MSKHTPGPWRFEADYPRQVTLKRKHWVVGQIDSPARGVGLVFGDDDANARLIAAAPDLLAALRELVAIDEWMVLVGGTEGPIAQEHIEEAARRRVPAIDAARAALAKTGAA